MTVSIAASTALATHSAQTPAALNRAGRLNPSQNQDSPPSSQANAGFASTLRVQQAPVVANVASVVAPATITIPAAIPGKTLPVGSVTLAAVRSGHNANAPTNGTQTTREKSTRADNKSAATSDTSAPPVPAPTILNNPVQPRPAQAANAQTAAAGNTPAQDAQTQAAPTPNTPASAIPTQAVPVLVAMLRDTPGQMPPVAQADTATAALPAMDDAPAPVAPSATMLTGATTEIVITAALASGVADQDAPPTATTVAAAPRRIAAPSVRAPINEDPLARTAVVPVTQHGAAKASEPVTPASTSPAAPVPYTAMATAAPATSDPQAPATTTPVQTPTDFATLVDSIARARDDNPAAAAAPVGVTMQHADFGHVSMQFTAHGQGLAVTLRSADPGFAPSVAAAAVTTGSATQSHAGSEHGARAQSDPRSDTARQNGGHNDAQAGGPRRQTHAAPIPQSGNDAADTAAIFA